MSSTSSSWRTGPPQAGQASSAVRLTWAPPQAGFVAVPDRNAVSPPELTRDAPVADVLHPLRVVLAAALGDEPEGARRGRRRAPARRAAPSARTTAPRGGAPPPCRSGSSGPRRGGAARSSGAGRDARTPGPPACGPRSGRGRRGRLGTVVGRSARRAAGYRSAGSPWRRPISKSSGSWAGVTLTAPVPNSGSIASSATIGMRRSTIGSSTSRPTRSRYARVVRVHRHRGVAQHRLRPRRRDGDHSRSRRPAGSRSARGARSPPPSPPPRWTAP